ncbi:hypothetical protein K458DRAFT_414369 [Lentithecium fluviatile CBS 122367]|uniref:Inhibitor I9 domain-containing protein n=1 Tax=Lentithecium fluviatile CBS 122367 TaxID=1168545 RepID=A0A6G1JDI9_9PLEO|nr:hypothetical protein K458DRAFT_414369 [Lentithecium fluviatile CBS 122367]
MRFALLSIIVALLAALAMAVPPKLHSVIISFPNDAPDHLLQAAKDMVLKGKGKITHEYNIIKGFAAEIAESTMPSIQALSTEYPPLIEGDMPVHTQGDKEKAKVGIHY